MILTLLVVVAFAGAVYYHYIQGAMTSTISALCAAIATAVAFGYYEPLTLNMAPGRFVDSMPSVMLIVLFSLTYIILRILIDALVPGNIRLPLWADRGFAVVFGIVAAMFATGTWAVAGQLLPFDAATTSRFEMQDRQVTAPMAGKSLDVKVLDEIKDPQDMTLPPERASSLLLPVDSFVLGYVNFVSGGSLAGQRTLKSTTPDLLTDAFAQRLTFGGAAKHTAMATGKEVQIDLVGTYLTANPVKVVNGDLPQIRGSFVPKETELKPGLLVLRVTFRDTATDEDGVVHLTPSMCRIYRSPDPSTSDVTTNLYPIGTLQGQGCIVYNRIDDPLFIKSTVPVDLVFQPRAGDLVKKGDAVVFAPGVFVEIKRFGRFSLEGKSVGLAPDSPAMGVYRKDGVLTLIKEKGGELLKEDNH